MRRLIPSGDDLRSYLGTVALLVFVLPVVVLILTLLDEDIAPRPVQTTNSGSASSEAAQRQARPADSRLDRNGGDVVHPLERQEQSSQTAPKDKSATSTRQLEPDQKAVYQPQDALGTPTGGSPTAAEAAMPMEQMPAGQLGSDTAAPAPPSEPAPASTEAPSPLVLSSAPATAEAPATVATSAPAAADTSTVSEPSAAVPTDPIFTPSEVPLEGVQGYELREFPR